MSPWKSRWSCGRWVNTPTAKRRPRTRPSARLCEETSSATAATTPASRMRASERCRSSDSGVVSDGLLLEAGVAHRDRAEAARAPARGAQHRFDHAHRAGLAVRARDTDERQRARRDSRRSARATSAQRRARVGARARPRPAPGRVAGGSSTSSALAPASIACGEEAVAVGLRAAQRHEQRARAHRARVVGHVADRVARGAVDARVETLDQLRHARAHPARSPATFALAARGAARPMPSRSTA